MKAIHYVILLMSSEDKDLKVKEDSYMDEKIRQANMQSDNIELEKWNGS